MNVSEDFLPHAVNDALPHALEHPGVSCIEDKAKEQHEQVQTGCFQDTGKIKPAQLLQILSGQ